MTLINKIKAWFVQPEPGSANYLEKVAKIVDSIRQKKGFENWVNRPKNNRKYTRARKHQFINNRYYNYGY